MAKWLRLFYVAVLISLPIKHSDRCCRNLIINEGFSHSGPLITMATTAAANGHIAKFWKGQFLTAIVQISFSYLFSIMVLRKQHIPSKNLLCCAHVGSFFKKNQESRRETINKRERPIWMYNTKAGKDADGLAVLTTYFYYFYNWNQSSYCFLSIWEFLLLFHHSTINQGGFLECFFRFYSICFSKQLVTFR